MIWNLIGIKKDEITLRENSYPDEYLQRNYLSSEVMITFSNQLMRGEYSHTDKNFFDLSLACYLFDKHSTEIPSWVENVRQKAQIRRKKSMDELYDSGIDSFVGEAALLNLIAGKAPDQAVMRSAVACLVPHLKTIPLKCGITKKWHYFACWLSVMANCMDETQVLFGMIKKNAAFPVGYPLLKRIAAAAKYELHNGQQMLRIHNAELRTDFLKYFDMHRTMVVPIQTTGDYNYALDYSYLFDMPLHGAYYLAWFYLQAFAPEPVEYFSREDMFALLTT
jgi:hypothetical protein